MCCSSAFATIWRLQLTQRSSRSEFQRRALPMLCLRSIYPKIARSSSCSTRCVCSRCRIGDSQATWPHHDARRVSCAQSSKKCSNYRSYSEHAPTTFRSSCLPVVHTSPPFIINSPCLLRAAILWMLKLKWCGAHISLNEGTYYFFFATPRRNADTSVHLGRCSAGACAQIRSGPRRGGHDNRL